jgi:ComF family protein
VSVALTRGLAAFRLATDALITATLGPLCAVCERPLEHPLYGAVCPSCWNAIKPLRPPLCGICGDPLASWRTISVELSRCPRCRRGAAAIDRGLSVVEYEGAMRRVVHAFKFDGRRSLAPRLGSLMREAGAELIAGADLAVPVPLHFWKRLRRGFNQAADLAHTLDLPVVHALRRTRMTHSQSGLAATPRRRNLRNAFAVPASIARRRLLDGRIVVLVDDVTTTGATLDACARALKAAGAREVRALTAARTVRGNRPNRT